MTVHTYEVTSGARRVLIAEGGPPRWRGDDTSVYLDTISLDGASEAQRGDHIDYRFGQRWGLRFDDENPREAEQHRMLLARMKETGLDGNPKIRDIVPYEEQVVMTASRLEDEALSRAEEMLEEIIKRQEGGRYAQTVQCAACGVMKSPQGIRGHLDIWANKRGTEEERAAHTKALADFDAERALKKAS